VSYLAFLSSKLLHDHLGHPHLPKSKQMGLELGKLQVLEYESLQLGKHLFPSYVNFFFDIHPDI